MGADTAEEGARTAHRLHVITIIWMSRANVMHEGDAAECEAGCRVGGSWEGNRKCSRLYILKTQTHFPKGHLCSSALAQEDSQINLEDAAACSPLSQRNETQFRPPF